MNGHPLLRPSDTLSVSAQLHYGKSNVTSSLQSKRRLNPNKAHPQERKQRSRKAHYRVVYKEVRDGLHSVECTSIVFEHLAGVLHAGVGNVLLVNEDPGRRGKSPTKSRFPTWSMPNHWSLVRGHIEPARAQSTTCPSQRRSQGRNSNIRRCRTWRWWVSARNGIPNR
ncbi:hypothetical protein GY45DRAFT_1067024 [Cubamyces sp. BRFM 1775]|nr:hypothetical protein GY45DRAFT_1067024 [Cubamyces sp. BRFM 1775]